METVTPESHRSRGARIAPRALEALFAGDDDFEPRRDVVVEPDRYDDLAERLDRLVQRDPTALDLDRIPLQELHDVLRGHRAEELALFGGLPTLFEDEGLDPVAHRLGLAFDAIRLGVLLLPDLLEVLEVAGGGAERELLRDEIVARVAVGDVAELAAATEFGDVVQQDDAHGSRSTPSPGTARGR